LLARKRKGENKPFDIRHRRVRLGVWEEVCVNLVIAVNSGNCNLKGKGNLTSRRPPAQQNRAEGFIAGLEQQKAEGKEKIGVTHFPCIGNKAQNLGNRREGRPGSSLEGARRPPGLKGLVGHEKKGVKLYKKGRAIQPREELVLKTDLGGEGEGGDSKKQQQER